MPMNWSTGGRILDLYDDVNLGLLAKSAFFEKVASLELGDPSTLERLEDRQFGVCFITKTGSVIRKYPIHDHTHTVLANAYFEMTHAQLPPEAKVAAATQIKAASELFGVAPTAAVAELAVAGAGEGKFYVHLGRLNKQAGRLDVTNLNLFEQLQDVYEANKDRYSRQEKLALAQAMGPIAEKYSLEIPADLKPFLVKNPCIDKEAFFSQIALRKQLVQDRKEAQHLLGEFMQKHAQFDAPETVKLLETFDKEFGLDAYWTRGLEPNQILGEKVAFHNAPVMGIGCRITPEDLKNFMAANGELVKKMFGKDLADRLVADPGALWDLPEESRKFIAARIEHGRENTPVAAT